jgi:hypothetical protein
VEEHCPVEHEHLIAELVWARKMFWSKAWVVVFDVFLGAQ